jgi:hypothetical protein
MPYEPLPASALFGFLLLMLGIRWLLVVGRRQPAWRVEDTKCTNCKADGFRSAPTGVNCCLDGFQM